MAVGGEEGEAMEGIDEGAGKVVMECWIVIHARVFGLKLEGEQLIVWKIPFLNWDERGMLGDCQLVDWNQNQSKDE